MQIVHDTDSREMRTVIDGQIAYVRYEIADGMLNICHTLVPKVMEGRGIASQLVRAAYDYAREQHLQPAAACPYAVVWLERHPEYRVEKQRSDTAAEH